MGAGTYSGYTEDAFKFADSGMPSSNKANYTKGSDGLYYYNNKSPDATATANAAASGVTDASAAAAGTKANELIQAGESAVGNATSAAGTNLSTVQSMVGNSTAQVGADLNTARSDAASGTQAATDLGASAADVKNTATQVGAQSDIFKQYADTLNRDATFSQANALPWLQTGNDLLSGDTNASGTAGAYNRLTAQMSPDAMAAGAATDTRKASSVAETTLLQSLARRGISAGSGAVAAALDKLKDREESSVAAMMTSARKVGLSMQADALKSGLTMALQSSGLGKSFADQAASDTAAASAQEEKATAALTSKGALQTQAANIVATQGNMFATSGNLALGIAAAKTNNTASGASALTAATNTQVAAQKVAADYYSTQGGSLLSMLTQQKYNVLTVLFGQ